ncbi:hypothetical protein J6590_013498 [Homalodisca vitripennis]|nr:hypothetical protein J6590_013498 [Homalodisca vitripennis]
MEVDNYLPSSVKYWLTATSKNDCFFSLVSKPSGQTERIGAIKIFLFGYSEPLRNILENSQLAEQGDIRILDVEPRTFWTFLKCVYGGSNFVIPKLSFQESVNLLRVVSNYFVTDMTPKIVSHIINLLTTGNVIDNIFCALSNPACFSYCKLQKAIMETV